MLAPDLEPVVQALRNRSTQNRECGIRQLLWVTGERDWCHAFAERWLCDSQSLPAVWVGEKADTFEKTDSVFPGQGKHFLGGELSTVVVDAHTGVDPNDIGALAGTLLPGGFFILLSPPPAQWLASGNSVLSRMLSHGVSLKQSLHLYIRRLIRVLQSDANVIALDQLDGLNLSTGSAHSASVDEASLVPFASQDQQLAVSAIDHVLSGHRRRPVVMTADRGRGKTIALAMAVSEWLSRGLARIIITAPSRRVVQPVFDWVVQQHPAVLVQGPELKKGDAVLVFMAPDELLRQRPDADVVLVDEAAALPLTMLETLLARYSRLVLSSTVHGYEGTGRGFLLRFQPLLEKLAPGWKSVRLEKAIRYANDDPLEQGVNRLLLLDAEPRQTPVDRSVDPELRWLEAAELALEDDLLEQVFGLLVQAHYQTSPMDLLHLLDAPDVRIAALMQAEAVMGVLLLVEEGGLSDEMMQSSFRGQRRPRGHLVPQTLVAQAGLRMSGALRGFRVMRIAVALEHRRQGLGQRLLSAAKELAENETLDFVASSFGADSGLQRFWQCAGYSPLHLGSSRNTVTGEHSLLVLSGVSEAGLSLQEQGKGCFFQQLLSRLPDDLAEMDHPLLFSLLPSLQKTEVTITAHDEAIVDAFAHYQRPYLASSSALRSWLAQMLQGEVPDGPSMSALLAKVLQCRTWQQVADLTGFSGQKQIETEMRKAASALLLRVNSHD